MENLLIKGTDEVPSVEFNIESGKYELSGRSLPEDAASFYKPIIDWLSQLRDSKKSGNLIFDMKLEYFNTASSKMILDLLNILEAIKSNGVNVVIKWHYPDGDDDMIEAGEEYSELIDVPFEMVSY